MIELLVTGLYNAADNVLSPLWGLWQGDRGNGLVLQSGVMLYLWFGSGLSAMP